MRTARVIEFILLFFAGPAALAVVMRPAFLFPAVWALGGLSLILLLRDPTFDRRTLWSARGLRAALPRMIFWFVLGAVVLTGLLLLRSPAEVLRLPREHPGLWLLILAIYPALSVYAQEVAFRALFFHRYALLFRTQWAMIAASAIAFGFAHVILLNWTAILLSTAGGILFGRTFWRTRSVLATCVEHTLYGWFLFTIGWGQYLYSGSMEP
jgi:membrane protease YdiL (CAAX protease family)